MDASHLMVAQIIPSDPLAHRAMAIMLGNGQLYFSSLGLIQFERLKDKNRCHVPFQHLAQSFPSRRDLAPSGRLMNQDLP